MRHRKMAGKKGAEVGKDVNGKKRGGYKTFLGFVLVKKLVLILLWVPLC